MPAEGLETVIAVRERAGTAKVRPEQASKGDDFDGGITAKSAFAAIRVALASFGAVVAA